MKTYRNCQGMTRRNCLQLGLGAAVGGGFVDALRMRAAGAGREAKPTSCILVWLDGGPTHYETFDPKPLAPKEIRGELSPIDTNVPGVRFSEHLKRLAGIADKLSVVRSIQHNQGNHGAGNHYMMTGAPHAHSRGLRRVCELSSEPGFGGGLRARRPGRVAGLFLDAAGFAIRRPELSRRQVRAVCRARRPQ